MKRLSGEKYFPKGFLWENVANTSILHSLPPSPSWPLCSPFHTSWCAHNTQIPHEVQQKLLSTDVMLLWRTEENVPSVLIKGLEGILEAVPHAFPTLFTLSIDIIPYTSVSQS